MKILHVAESIRGGCGTYLNQIVPQQIEELGSDNIRVIVPDAHKAQTPDIPAHRVSFFERPKRSLTSLLSLGREIGRQVDAFEPDIIHAHSTFAGAVTRLMYGWRKKRPAIVYCPHGWVFDVRASSWKQRLMERAERLMSGLCDIVVAISEYEAIQGRRIGIGNDRIRVVLNGLRLIAPEAVPAKWQDDRLKILFVGRLDLQKGFDVLVESILPLSEKVALRVIGEAVLTDGTRPAMAFRNIEYLGWQNESQIQGHLAVADVVVMPSRWEGFGLVAIEAMRAGRAVIASRVGGLPEVVVDGETGILIPPDDAAALRAALLSYEREALARFGVNGRRYFEERFTIERTHSVVMSLYREVVAGRSNKMPRSSRSTAQAI
jgi:glycosyltransferase involved in cell wall biosynthesis